MICLPKSGEAVPRLRRAETGGTGYSIKAIAWAYNYDAAAAVARTRRYQTATTGIATADTRRTISPPLRSNTQRDTRRRESHL